MAPPSLPKTLWDDEQVVMPSSLSAALKSELETLGRFDEACSSRPPEREIFGGEGEEDATIHFVHRFKASSARTQYVAMSPCKTFDAISNDLMSFIFDGEVSILDLPCGSGGGLFGYLCTVAELRRQAVLPRMPVILKIVAADISEDARKIHEAMLARLIPELDDVGIRIDAVYKPWNVTDPFSTAALVDFWLSKCPDDEEYLVFVSAFSGFTDKHTEQVLRAFDLIITRFYDKYCTLTWIEPTMRSSKRVLERLTTWITSWFSSTLSQRSPFTEKEYHYRHPFTAQRIPGRVQARSFSRKSSP